MKVECGTNGIISEVYGTRLKNHCGTELLLWDKKNNEWVWVDMYLCYPAA